MPHNYDAVHAVGDCVGKVAPVADLSLYPLCYSSLIRATLLFVPLRLRLARRGYQEDNAI